MPSWCGMATLLDSIHNSVGSLRRFSLTERTRAERMLTFDALALAEWLFGSTAPTIRVPDLAAYQSLRYAVATSTWCSGWPGRSRHRGCPTTGSPRRWRATSTSSTL